MKENTEILDRIERYSKGKMGLEEKLTFERELASDNSLREQLEFSQIVDQMIIGNEAWNLKAQMQKDLYKPKPRIWTYLSVSLAVLMASAGLFVVFKKKEVKKEVVNQASTVQKIVVASKEQVGDRKSSVVVNSSKTPISQEKNTNVAQASNKAELKPVTTKAEVVQNEAIPASIQASSGSSVVSKQNLAVAPKVDPCAGFVGNVDFYSLPSCKEQETGEVHVKVETVKGGSAPFTFKLGERSAKSSFSHLASGQYSLFIKDANNCLVENTKKVIVGEKKCAERKEYVFNPEYDSSWPIPYDNEKQASGFKILEKSGKVFFQTSVSASHPTEWKGESNTGLVLGMGLYFFTIEYADGSVDEGSIVVTR